MSGTEPPVETATRLAAAGHLDPAELPRLIEQVVASLRGDDSVEAEARNILDRIERELPALEGRIDRLMHQYGL